MAEPELTLSDINYNNLADKFIKAKPWSKFTIDAYELAFDPHWLKFFVTNFNFKIELARPAWAHKRIVKIYFPPSIEERNVRRSYFYGIPTKEEKEHPKRHIWWKRAERLGKQIGFYSEWDAFLDRLKMKKQGE